jgi:hypothetical protein
MNMASNIFHIIRKEIDKKDLGKYFPSVEDYQNNQTMFKFSDVVEF